jgi:hypothetical protein
MEGPVPARPLGAEVLHHAARGHARGRQLRPERVCVEGLDAEREVVEVLALDNNNYMFGDRVAKEFIMNQNRAAAKTGTWTPKAETR